MSNDTTTTSSPTLTFGDSDTGFWSTGDQISIVAGGTKKSVDNYKKVHVARRRSAKQRRPWIWEVTNAEPTTLTVSYDL